MAQYGGWPVTIHSEHTAYVYIDHGKHWEIRIALDWFPYLFIMNVNSFNHDKICTFIVANNKYKVYFDIFNLIWRKSLKFKAFQGKMSKFQDFQGRTCNFQAFPYNCQNFMTFQGCTNHVKLVLIQLIYQSKMQNLVQKKLKFAQNISEISQSKHKT